ncbi:MAG: GntR family transcriptional regulator [Steroidobacteraceae bacterium]
MIPFKVRLAPGQPIVEQVCFAATRAILAGELKAGEPFPSVRVLAAELRVHPNTAMKIVQFLVQEKWLIAQPGVGTVVATPPRARAGDRRKLLEGEVEKLVVEAMRVGMTSTELVQAVEDQWRSLQKLRSVSGDR